jgi:hypothetical protein
MTIIEIFSDIFFHSIIILSVFERLKKLFQSFKEYESTKDTKRILGELLILFLVLIISIFLYNFFIYK